MYGLSARILVLLALGIAVLSSAPAESPKRIAIIGGGIGGSAAAHFVRTILNETFANIDVTLFERDDRIGGRLYSLDFDGYRQELGADVCHLGNFFCVEFARMLQVGFDVAAEVAARGPGSLAIRNGTHYLYRSDEYAWNLLNFYNVLRTFGLMDTLTFESYVSESFHKWQQQYQDPLPWKTVAEFLNRYQLKSETALSLASAMRQRGFHIPIIEGLVSPVTKVIYQLESNAIHALAGQIAVTGSLDPKKLFTVGIGNEKMAQKLVERSNVDLRLNTPVLSITRDEKTDGYFVSSSASGELRTDLFDYVVMAVPLELSKIELIGVPQQKMRQYVELFVTIIRAKLNTNFWKFSDASQATPEHVMQAFNQNGLDNFTSMSISHTYEDGTHLIKLFSPQSLTQEQLDEMFVGFDPDKYHEKFWHPYPILEPNIPFPDLEIVPGFYYPSAFESVGSSIEVSILSARNAIRLIAKREKEKALRTEKQRELRSDSSDL